MKCLGRRLFTDDSLLNYQQRMEQFYRDLIDVIRAEDCYLALEDSDFKDYIDEHDLLLFEDTLHSEQCDHSFEDVLKSMTAKGYEIVLNFDSPRNVLGNVVVKLGEKWFAFGTCKNDSDEGFQVTEIWPLKYVLPRIWKMEAKLSCTCMVKRVG